MSFLVHSLDSAFSTWPCLREGMGCREKRGQKKSPLHVTGVRGPPNSTLPNEILFFNIYFFFFFRTEVQFTFFFLGWGEVIMKNKTEEPWRRHRPCKAWGIVTSSRVFFRTLVLGLCFEGRAWGAPTSLAGPLACFCTFLIIFPDPGHPTSSTPKNTLFFNVHVN